MLFEKSRSFINRRTSRRIGHRNWLKGKGDNGISNGVLIRGVKCNRTFTRSWKGKLIPKRIFNSNFTRSLNKNLVFKRCCKRMSIGISIGCRIEVYSILKNQMLEIGNRILNRSCFF